MAAEGAYEGTIDPLMKALDDTIADIERGLNRKFDLETRIVVTQALVALANDLERRARARVNW